MGGGGVVCWGVCKSCHASSLRIEQNAQKCCSISNLGDCQDVIEQIELALKSDLEAKSLNQKTCRAPSTSAVLQCSGLTSFSHHPSVQLACQATSNSKSKQQACHMAILSSWYEDCTNAHAKHLLP